MTATAGAQGWRERAYRVAFGKPVDFARVFGELVCNRIDAEPHLRQWFDAMSDEQARFHFRGDRPLEAEHLRLGLRFFHAWRVDMLRRRIGDRLDSARIIDVGDVDGMILKHLDKSGLGYNLAPSAVENIRAHGVEALQGDGHTMPFEEGSFDYVLCFETLEHVENPHQVLSELARVCRPEGRVFVSIPWVPRTFIHPRDPSQPRGEMHIFEFCRADFASVLSHTPLRLEWDAVCDLFGPPRNAEQRFYLRWNRDRHIVAGGFRKFQFFELSPQPVRGEAP